MICLESIERGKILSVQYLGYIANARPLHCQGQLCLRDQRVRLLVATVVGLPLYPCIHDAIWLFVIECLVGGVVVFANQSDAPVDEWNLPRLVVVVVSELDKSCAATRLPC